MEKIQTRVLREIWKGNGRYNLDELTKNTFLKKRQVYDAVLHLEDRKLIIIEREVFGGGYKNPPRKRLHISPNLKRKDKIKRVIQNGN